jgi:hypothetical protein
MYLSQEGHWKAFKKFSEETIEDVSGGTQAQ